MTALEIQKKMTGYTNLELILEQITPEHATRIMMLVDHILDGATGNAYHLSQFILNKVELEKIKE